ncbi:hypothetical protein SAMN05216224_10866 [Thioclava dalianensis]|uniref:hypothetical protein n=1 Tax=Thioclava dalianensis TaxID=1185766 RepID=UPI0008F6553F|nr:hypothetical protein [Thioclava dalianensis]SFN63066.1 hypothetical protein SAMN05216224_10866 [Thioclava dalianensis]
MTAMRKETKEGWVAFARNITAVVTASTLLVTSFWYLAGPRIKADLGELITEQMGLSADDLEQIQASQESIRNSIQSQQNTIATISKTQAQVADTVKKVVDRLAALEEAKRVEGTPPILFSARGNSVTNGVVGGVVRQTWMIKKLRDCGRPRSRAYFINGNSITHVFRDKSTTDREGYGVSLDISTDFQPVRFSARIPANEDVQPTGDGVALAYLIVDWPERCPNVPPMRSPDVPFRILPKQQ